MIVDNQIDLTKTKIGVVGAGSWGTALANLLALKGFMIDLWAFEKEVKDHIESLKMNSEFLPGVSHEPQKVFEPGDEVLVRIIEIDKEQERVSLSMRRLPEDDVARWVIEN